MRNRRPGGGGGDGADGEGAARYRPAKKGFNPILLAIPAVIVLIAGALFFTGFFEDKSDKVQQAAQNLFQAIQGRRLDSTWKFIQKKTQDEAKEADRNEIRDFFSDVEDFSFDCEITAIGQNGDKWEMDVKFSAKGKIKDKQGNVKPLDNSKEDHRLIWQMERGGWILIDDTHKAFFQRP